MASPLTRFTLDDDELELASNDNQVSTYTQQMRLAAINEFTKAGLPTDGADFKALLGALADMDRTAATNKRLEIDKADSDSSREVLEIVRRMHERNAHGLASEEAVRDAYPEPSVTDLPEIEYDREQLEMGLVSDNSKDFMKRMKGGREAGIAATIDTTRKES